MADISSSWRSNSNRNTALYPTADHSHHNPYSEINNQYYSQQAHPPRASNGKGRGRGKAKRSGGPQRPNFSHLPHLGYPIYNSQEIRKFWTANLPPRPEWSQNPKGILNNFCQHLTHPLPKYHSQQVILPGFTQPLFRATVHLEIAPDIVGIGDDLSKKEAEKIAALSVCFQLGMKNMFDENNLPVSSLNAPPDGKPRNLMPDGTQLTLDQAKAYMSFYCRKFNFGSPEIQYENGKKGRPTWIATIFVGGRKIGLGHAVNKKDSLNEAYIDTVVYLGECDPDLWVEFRQSAESQEAAAGGTIPAVVFKLSNQTEQDLRQIVYSSMDCELYRRAKTLLERTRGSASAPHQANQGTANNPSRKNQTNNTSNSRQSALKEKSSALRDRLDAYQTNTSPEVVKLREQRQSLPVTAHSSVVSSALASNPITILMAATGSGKTTQVPQLILDEATMKGEGAKCNIICTQPRRIAAISVAQRVAAERNEKLSESVGYQVRFESKPPTPDGSILFCTTGIFLRRLQNDMDSATGGFLDSITHIVVDEVHERDIETDLLLFCLRRVLKDRKEKGKSEIKVLLMSATVDPTLFEQYFSDGNGGKPAPVISIPGRSFPVEKHYLEEVHRDLRQLNLPTARGGWVWGDPKVQKYTQRELQEPLALDPVTGKSLRDSDDLEMPFALIALVVAWVLSKSSEGHVLVFLPGWEEIKGVQTILTDPRQFPLLNLNFNDSSKFEVHVLHSAIPVADQQLVFSPPPKGVRRVILSTNIAETSVTIPDVVFVVDTGKIKEKRFDPERHLSSLITAWVGTSNLNQRAGRAGRHRSGDYYGLLSKRRYDALNIHSTVEMKRTDLSNLVMHVKALNFPNMEAEDVLAQTIEPPERERVSAAMSHLQSIGALDRHKDLTALGRVLLQLPVEAQIGKLLLLGSFFKCLEPALNLAAILTNRDPFLSPPAAKAEADRVKSSWAPLEFRSDPLASLAAFKAWSNLHAAGDNYKTNKFTNENFLSRPALFQIAQVKTHLLASLRRAGVLAISGGGGQSDNHYSRRNDIPPHLNKNSDSLPLAAALIAVAVAPNFAVRKSARVFATDKDRTCIIHASSVNSYKKQAAAGDDIPLQNERQLFAFGEKSLLPQRPGEKGKEQMSLRATTRLDPLGYMLFGARQLQPYPSGLRCDGWLPITGNAGALDDVERLKHVLDASLLRVFDGLLAQTIENNPRLPKRRARVVLPPPKRISAAAKKAQEADEEESVDSEFEVDEEEDQDEVVPVQFGKLTHGEIQDLQRLTEEVVSLLNKYSEERLATDVNTSRAPSRPDSRATNRPLINRLQPMGYGSEGGGVHGGNSSAGPSRPGSRLTNQIEPSNTHPAQQSSWNHPGPAIQHGVPSKLPPGVGYMNWSNGVSSFPPPPPPASSQGGTWQQQQQHPLQQRNPHPSSSSARWR
ncbi:hypothetical protein PGT21_014362 [Puccinia graminis f. sp. tritici]|uniref:ATP-dependent RNA helicase A n=2 Tax=Puccinia graminis f. sp. tritici TaxID=56615 RepID=H6QQ22_PUCGT|nr:uncharacterized protein PGTG_20968 [Puccinia graminis f. sp. tritici CRL 75-36-700-3]EHS64505.1 hypothetical protein PGTG_20968 [Puccinia graminis f. sp. tritici CRL 75-36-700-3]KAA1110211.1 hypothetical protein PGT21_014362 [Puccinia graminis f. sp. tritici]